MQSRGSVLTGTDQCGAVVRGSASAAELHLDQDHNQKRGKADADKDKWTDHSSHPCRRVFGYGYGANLNLTVDFTEFDVVQQHARQVLGQRDE
jgi:hypothetical protein